MSYKKAKDILPDNIIKQIQEYVDGEYLYIPRNEENKKQWGESTNSRIENKQRNQQIYRDYLSGESTSSLVSKYFLSLKSIQRIIRQNKNE